MKTMMAAVAGVVMMVAAAGAQAPAGAPAGATGICKDGSYWTGATKSGACRGHKGIQTWYADAAAAPSAAATKPSAASMPVAKPAPKAPAMPAPTPAPAAVSRPVPTPAPAPAAMPATAATAATAKRGPAAAAAAKTQAPGGGPGLVWLNTDSNVYHCNGDTYYGKTKAGQYMSEAAAQAKGAHGERGKTCAGK